MPQDPIYARTRRGRSAVVTRQIGNTYNRTSGENLPITVDTTVRWVSKEPVKYSRLLRATATQQRIGDTTFVFWLRDIQTDFTELDTEDFITYENVRFDVVTSEQFDTGLVVTATELRRAVEDIGEVPANAIFDRAGDVIKDRTGDNILSRV